MAEAESQVKAKKGGATATVIVTILVMLLIFYALHLVGYVDMSKLIDLIKGLIGL